MMAVSVVAQTRIEELDLTLATGVRAGHWVFGNGLSAADNAADLPPELLDQGRPYSGTSRIQRESELLFDRVKALLTAAGATPAGVVRLDQFYRSWTSVPHYHVARHAAFAGEVSIPSSTSILMEGLVWPQAEVHLELLGVAGDAPPPVPMTPDGLDVPPVMGFAPVVKANQLVFLAGQMAEADGHAGIAPEARVPETHYWKGHAVFLETDFILRHKFEVALNAAGSSIERVVKGQAYVSDITEAPAVMRAWKGFFGEHAPALSIIPTSVPGFNCKEAHIEINLVAATMPVESVNDEPNAALDGVAQAVKTGDLTFCSGTVAADSSGPLPGAMIPPGRRWFASSAANQARSIIEQWDRLSRRVGADLTDAVRIQLFMTDLSEFRDVATVLRQRFGPVPVPLSVVQVPSPLIVPGCTIMGDLCLYTPDEELYDRS